jgi:peptide/nickel transport system permease protein
VTNKATLAGAALIVGLAAAMVAAPWAGAYDPAEIDPLIRLRGLSAEHWMGTDSLGRDVLGRSLWGGRVSIVVGLCVALLATAMGVLLGLVAGFLRSLDGLIMRTMDGLMAFPGILLAIALTAFMRPGLATVIVAIAVPELPKVARLARSLVLRLREQAFVEAAHAAGTPLPRIVRRHVLPMMAGPLIVQATLIAAWAILIEATLSFLGVGLPAHLPSWGNMMAEGRAVVAIAPHIVLWPGFLIALAVLAINLLGDGLRDALDPRLPHKRTAS